MQSIHTVEYYWALEKEGNPDTYHNMGETLETVWKVKEARPKGQILYDPTCTRYLELPSA